MDRQLLYTHNMCFVFKKPRSAGSLLKFPRHMHLLFHPPSCFKVEWRRSKDDMLSNTDAMIVKIQHAHHLLFWTQDYNNPFDIYRNRKQSYFLAGSLTGQWCMYLCVCMTHILYERTGTLPSYCSTCFLQVNSVLTKQLIAFQQQRSHLWRWKLTH